MASVSDLTKKGLIMHFFLPYNRQQNKQKADCHMAVRPAVDIFFLRENSRAA